ncbi:unnamed protein product [Paramecium octaurelia]|uniref:Uncharacterized protein n=1 Tax=Paramecium octaurelia TaxID=43137 RepID=A0A8S1Y7E1_PAROT|nr:unnamed protein product [Paramecium octaurelia]
MTLSIKLINNKLILYLSLTFPHLYPAKANRTSKRLQSLQTSKRHQLKSEEHPKLIIHDSIITLHHKEENIAHRRYPLLNIPNIPNYKVNKLLNSNSDR